MGRVSLLLAATVLTAAALGQEIQLAGPSSPIARGGSAVVLVTGLADAELPAAVVEIEPAAGITLLPGKLWGGGQNFVWVLVAPDAPPGPRTLTVGLGRQYLPLHRALTVQVEAATEVVRQARQAAIAAELLGPLEAMARDTAAAAASLRQKYPGRSGSCPLEVAGPRPPPVPPPPPEPPPIVTGKRIAVVLYETGTSNERFNAFLLSLRHPQSDVAKYLKEKGHLLDILDQQNASPKWLGAIQQRNLALPALIFADAGSFSVLSAEELRLPLTPGQFLDKLKANGG